MKVKKFIRFMVEVISEFEKEHRLGTAHVYQYSLNAFRSFIKARACWAHSLDAALVKEFEGYMINRSLMPGTSATYMRMLRATYNRAAVLNLVGVYNRSLFADVYTGTDSMVKRAFPPEAMGRWLLVDEKISSYTARHTWATTACTQGASIEMVCSAMGHSSSRVTQRYVKTFENNKINEMNDLLICCVKRMAIGG